MQIPVGEEPEAECGSEQWPQYVQLQCWSWRIVFLFQPNDDGTQMYSGFGSKFLLMAGCRYQSTLVGSAVVMPIAPEEEGRLAVLTLFRNESFDQVLRFLLLPCLDLYFPLVASTPSLMLGETPPSLTFVC